MICWARTVSVLEDKTSREACSRDGLVVVLLLLLLLLLLLQDLVGGTSSAVVADETPQRKRGRALTMTVVFVVSRIKKHGQCNVSRCKWKRKSESRY